MNSGMKLPSILFPSSILILFGLLWKIYDLVAEKGVACIMFLVSPSLRGSMWNPRTILKVGSVREMLLHFSRTFRVFSLLFWWTGWCGTLLISGKIVKLILVRTPRTELIRRLFLGFTGPKCTWSNLREGRSLIKERVDKAGFSGWMLCRKLWSKWS